MIINEILEDIRSERVKKVILDTDTYNEIDDQYALAYCYLSGRIELMSINATLFNNERSDGYEDGMLKSYEEIHRVLTSIDPDYNIPVYYGSRTTVQLNGGAVSSPAADNIISSVKNSDEVVYILAIGAITNVASAIMKDPSIKDNMVVIWLGGNQLDLKNADEFNLVQDYAAGQIVINSGVSLLLCPAWSVTSALTADIELIHELDGLNKIGSYLVGITDREWGKSNFSPDWYRIIWDLAAPAIIDCPECAEIDVVVSPVFTDERTYAFDSTRHKMMCLKSIDREKVYASAWKLLKSHKDK